MLLALALLAATPTPVVLCDPGAADPASLAALDALLRTAVVATGDCGVPGFQARFRGPDGAVTLELAPPDAAALSRPTPFLARPGGALVRAAAAGRLPEIAVLVEGMLAEYRGALLRRSGSSQGSAAAAGTGAGLRGALPRRRAGTAGPGGPSKARTGAGTAGDPTDAKGSGPVAAAPDAPGTGVPTAGAVSREPAAATAGVPGDGAPPPVPVPIPGARVAALPPPVARSAPPLAAPVASRGIELSAAAYAGLRVRQGGPAPEVGLLAQAGPVFARAGWQSPLDLETGGQALAITSLSGSLGVQVPALESGKLAVFGLASVEAEHTSAGGRTHAAGGAIGAGAGARAVLALPAGLSVNLLAQVVWLPGGVALAVRSTSGTRAAPSLDPDPGLRLAFALGWAPGSGGTP